MVLPVNDRPLFVDSLGNPVTLDKMTINVYEGQEVVLPFWVHDIEGDEVLASVNSTLVELDEANRQIHLSPTVVVVGTITFTLAIWDVEEPSVRITRDFKVIVENLNDPMDDPEILAPTSGTMIWQGLPTSFMAVCWDPDIQYGQELVFSWISSISGWMGTGASILVALHEIGVHEIQLTVSDGEYMKTTSIEIIVAEYDNDGDGIAAASVDSDEDGYPDEWNEGKTAADSITGLKIDDFPTDPAASDDTDGDGYPDEWNEGKTAADSITGLKIDKYPKDAKRWEEEDDSPSVGLVGVIAAIGIIAGVMRRRGRS